MMHDGWMHWGPGGFGGLWMGPVFWIILLGLVVWLAVLLARRGGNGGGPVSPPAKTPREILDERFARGEIDDEEYKRRRDLLGS